MHDPKHVHTHWYDNMPDLFCSEQQFDTHVDTVS